jgi:hypothetical protein
MRRNPLGALEGSLRNIFVEQAVIALSFSLTPAFKPVITARDRHEPF